MERQSSPMALEHLRVLELPGLAGAYCGKLLADLGADVIKIEPPAGDPGRALAPFAGDIPDPERSLSFINFNTNKRSAVLDLDTDEGRRQLRTLIPTVDVVIESYRPGHLAALGLGYDHLRALNPGIVLTSITPFGQTGPYSQFQGPDLVANAMSGLLSLQGDPDMPPCNAPFDQGYQLTSIHAAVATLYALHERRVTGMGDHVDISMQEVVGHMNFPVARYDLNGEILPRPGRGGNQPAVNAFPVQDGWVHMWPNRWDRLIDFLDIEELKDPKYNERDYRMVTANDIDDLITMKTLEFTKLELTQQAQAHGIPVAPVSTTEDFVTSEHILQRGYFIEQDHPVLGTFRMAGPPYRLSVTPWRSRRPAPLLGQHTAEVLAEAANPAITVRERSAAAGSAGTARPFKGIRILEIGTAFAGPFATRYLAELGAEVIKVESSLFAMQRETTGGYSQSFPGGRSALFMEINRSKRSITLDLHHPKAQELARRIAAKSDMVLANFRPGALDNWNVGYKDLTQVNPAIIMLEMPGLGNAGPHAKYISYGQTLMAYSGLMRLWGYPESSEDRRCKLAYPDWVGGGKAALALLAALAYRDRTGLGQYIELAQVEAAGAMASVSHLDYFLNGRLAEPSGNRHATFAPYPLPPCRGDDRWVAIGITDDRQWAALCTAIGAADLGSDEGLATAAGRKAREAEIDARIGQWTRQYTPHQAMRLLQRAGVPAGAVQNGEDLWYDPHLRERGYTVAVDQPFLGPAIEPGITMRFRNAQPPGPRGAAYLGEANEYVFGELLGLSAAEIAALHEEKVLI